jgi:hypothetical protein
VAIWQWFLDSAGFLLLALVLYGVALVVRRHRLSRFGGTFELSVRLRDVELGHGWVLGLGRYRDDRVEWFRIFSLWPRPKLVWLRSDLVYESQRPRQGREQFSLYSGNVVVTCSSPAGTVLLAMSPSALTGLQSWLEAAPPGAPGRRDG